MMMIPFKCPHCKKPLRVKKELAGKRAACPACKKPIVIPAPMAAPADLEAFAAATLKEEAAAKEEVVGKPVKFTCSWCDEQVEVPADLAGKQTPCPACKRIVKVPLPKADKPKDWRDLAKQGPSAALINQPEQLDGAWGTEFKGRVSRSSLEGAEALPEVELEPIGLGGWFRRGVIFTGVLGLALGAFFVLDWQRQTRRENRAVAEADAFLKLKVGDKEWTDRLPVLMPLVRKADAELKLRAGKLAVPVRDEFFKARGAFQNVKETNVDHDLFLLDLALAQIGLAGNEDQIYAKTRFEWEAVKKEVDQTLRRIKDKDAKVVAVREVAGALLFHDQPQLAVTVPIAVSGAGDPSKSPALPQQNALIFALGDEKAALQAIGKADANEDPKKGAKKQSDLSMQSRIALAEGHAWKGELAEARKYVEQPGLDYHKFPAAVGVASVLLANKKNPEGPKQAAPFVADALKWAKGVPNNWPVLQLVRVAARTDQAGQVQDHVKNLPGPFKRRAQLELFLAQLEKDGASVNADQLVAQLPDKEGPNRALAWLALNRHLAHHGLAAKMPDGEDVDYEVFAKLGLALGGQDRRAE
jgi:hypothetical protein